MNALKAAGREFVGLFIDDGSMALAIVCWLLLNWWWVPRASLSPGWHGILMAAGLVAIVVENSLRHARRR